MNLSDNDSGSSSEEDYNVVKVINNARVPEEFEELTGESSQEEANVEEEVFAESEAEVVAESEAEVDEESETDAESEAETAVVTDKEVKQVEPKITKTVPNKKNVYRDIILACFNHYANETISLSKIKSYAHTEHDISDHQQTFLKKALKKLIDEEIVKNQKGVGLAGSFKLVPQKPVQVKKITKPKVQSGGKIKIAKITADVYGSSTNAQPMEAKPKTVKKVGLKKNTNNKEDIKENVDPPTKKGKAGPKKDTVVKKPKEATVKTKEATTKPEKATTKSKGETAKPKQAIKRGASKKEEELSQDDHNEEVPKKIRKPVPKKIVAPKAPEVAAKKITVSKKVPSKTTVVAIRKSLDGDKKMIAVSRPKRKG